MKNSYLKFIIMIILLVFICSYYVSNSGYYEYHMQERTILTNEKIKKFERDVEKNKDIDIKDYLEYEEVDYSNKFTDLIYNISYKAGEISRKGMKALFKKLSYLIED